VNVAPWPHGDPDRIVRDVLAEPAYRSMLYSTNVAPKATLLQLAWAWLVDRFAPLLRPLAHALAASHTAGTIVGIVLVGFALAGLAFIAFRLVVAFARPLRGPAARASFAQALTATRTSLDWRGVAREAAARGDFGNAVAALFSAALVALDERAVVAFDATRTPGEYRRLVRRARLDAAPPFDDLAERFVRAAYAQEATGRPDFESAERAFDAFEPAVAR
jgi:hypothetical protein